MDDYYIDLPTWYESRELSYCPKHFVISNTPLTEESKNWILNKLSGRFCLLPSNNFDDILILDFNIIGQVAFEDSKEAVLYELTWS